MDYYKTILHVIQNVSNFVKGKDYLLLMINNIYTYNAKLLLLLPYLLLHAGINKQ